MRALSNPYAQIADHIYEAGYAMEFWQKHYRRGIDVGCGWRVASPLLIGLDRKIGLWVDSSNLTHTSTPHVCCEVLRLPLRDGCMDMVVGLHILEHFSDPLQPLTEWLRVLKPGGRLVQVVPDWRYTWSCDRPEDRSDPDGHRKDYTAEIISEVLASLVGTKLLDVREVCRNWSVGGAVEKLW